MIFSERTQTISTLGIVEIFTWGTTYYLLAVLAGPIGQDTGWSVGTITGGMSIGLLVSGLAARRIGGLIQAYGGRRILVAGIVLSAIGLGMLGLAHSVSIYFLAWSVLGLGMGASLYDAAFSTLGRIYGREARSAITTLTLWGGFASTVCWPATAWLVEAVGWRGTCFAYTLFHLSVTLPLCWFGLPEAAPPALEIAQSEHKATTRPRNAIDLRFWCIALAGTVLAMLVSIWSIHLITILTAEGHSLAVAVGLGTLIGPAQVAARLVEMLGRGKHHPFWTMVAANGLVFLGFLGLLLDIPAAVALVAYGAGNGLWSIARGTLPLAVFGAEIYAQVMGKIASIALIAAAVAPLLGAGLIESFGPRTTLMVLTFGALLPCCAAVILWWNLDP